VAYLVQPRLVNEPFSDPGLLLDFRFGRRALLFDIGDLGPLSSREVLRVTDVFVSHMHLDHFAGFDRLLRLNLYQPVTVRLFGPPGLGDAVEAKLGAYTWNLLGPRSADLAFLTAEWTPAGHACSDLFRAREAFRRRQAEPPRLAPGLILDEEDFRVEAAMLDHGIPCLAFAFQEKTRVNVLKDRLAGLGLPVGPWLTQAKRAARRGEAADTPLAAPGERPVTLGALLDAGALGLGPGQRVAYVTDIAHTPENVAAATGLARGADLLFIEAGFLDADREVAAGKRHLTAAQAGGIARAAGVRNAVPMHFSPRYLEREDELRREFGDAFALT